jgi:hypothetical protein
MSALRQAIGAAYPAHHMDPETVASITRAMQKREMREKAHIIAAPMRALMDLLATGEAYEIDGRVVMSMPDIDAQFAERAEWVEVPPAIEGWRDCWQRLAPDISTYYLGVLAARLRDDKPITPRLVEQARAEFDATVQRLVDIPPWKVTSAIRTTEIAWEIEKLQRGEAA